MSKHGIKANAMRSMSEEVAATYIGRRAICARGFLGTVLSVVVKDRSETGECVPLFKGVTEDGRPWQTVCPTWVESSDRRRQTMEALEKIEKVLNLGAPTPSELVLGAALQFALGQPRVDSKYEWLFEEIEGPAAKCDEPLRGKTNQRELAPA